MCTVSVKIDEAVLRDVLPELDSTAAISRWAQLLIEQHIDALTKERAAADEYVLDRDMTPEELCAVVVKDVKAIYADNSI